MWKVLCMWDIDPYPGVLGPLENIAEVTVGDPEQKTLVDVIGEYDVYLASLRVRVDKETISRAQKLKVIATPSTGLDHIELEEAEKTGIVVLSIKEEHDLLGQITATAEMAWCLLLSTARKLPWAFDAAKQGVWARDLFRGHQIAYTTLGILGYGRLGKMVADYGKAFRMKTIACDIEDFKAVDVDRVDFFTLLTESDVLSIHVHLTPENVGLIGTEELAMMKPGSILINTSRGAVVDQNALLYALEHGPIAGAGIDVIHGEWDADLYNHPLIRYARTHENLVVSPHLGGVAHESQRMALDFTVRKTVSYLEAHPETV